MTVKTLTFGSLTEYSHFVLTLRFLFVSLFIFEIPAESSKIRSKAKLRLQYITAWPHLIFVAHHGAATANNDVCVVECVECVSVAKISHEPLSKF